MTPEMFTMPYPLIHMWRLVNVVGVEVFGIGIDTIERKEF